LLVSAFRFPRRSGQYDNSKLLNLGNNRWSFKPELGISEFSAVGVAWQLRWGDRY